MSISLTFPGRIVAAALLASVLFSAPSAAQRQIEPVGVRVYPYWDSLLGAERKAILKEADLENPFDRVNPADLFEVLLEEGQPAWLASIVRRAIVQRPEKINDITEALIRLKDIIIRLDESGELRDALADALPELRSRIGVLSREEAARRAAEAAEVQRLYVLMQPSSPRPPDEYESRLALKTFANEHPGTVAGAKALYLFGKKGAFDDPRDDITIFMDTMKIVGELESGKFPPCEWVDRAPSLVPIHGIYELSPGDDVSPADVDRIIDRIIAAYADFVVRHLDNNGTNLGIVEQIVRRQIPDLLRQKFRDELRDIGDDQKRYDGIRVRIAEEESRTFDDLAKRTKNPDGVRYLLALHDRLGLEEFFAQAGPVWRQRALAAMATELFDEREYTAAAAAYRRYLGEFPESNWAWVAAIRLGQAQVESRDFEAARQALRATAVRYAMQPTGRIVALAYAAEASAALGDFAGELEDLTLAFKAWDPEAPSFMEVSFPSWLPLYIRPPNAFTKDLRRNVISARAAALPARLAPANGAEFEKARWWLEHGDPDGAVSILERVSKEASPPLRAEAASLARRARLERALGWIDVKSARLDEAAAAREFEALAAESQDFIALAARIARAALAWRQAQPDEARRRMNEGLEAWRRIQQDMPAPATGSIEEDVLAIRDRALGPDSRFSLRKSNASANLFPPGPHPYLFVSPRTEVVQADGRREQVVISRSLPNLPNVLFMDLEQEALLSTLMSRFGATTAQQNAMTTQPARPSTEIVTLVQEFFPMWEGLDPGWHFTGGPHLSSIEYKDDLRARAVASMNKGSIGAEILLEKRDGVWTITGIGAEWFSVN